MNLSSSNLQFVDTLVPSSSAMFNKPLLWPFCDPDWKKQSSVFRLFNSSIYLMDDTGHLVPIPLPKSLMLNNLPVCIRALSTNTSILWFLYFSLKFSNLNKRSNCSKMILLSKYGSTPRWAVIVAEYFP